MGMKVNICIVTSLPGKGVVMEILIELDGKRIAVNEFVGEFLVNTLAGSLSTLRGVDPNWKEARIEIRR